jgi:hypothetical protein
LDREKSSPDYSFVISDEILNLQSIDQVLGSAAATRRTGACIHKTRRGELTEKVRNTVDNWDINA